MIEKVKNTIINNGLIEKGEHIVLGLSGGPDSVCLFHVLHSLREQFSLTLHAVHVNHQFRPGAAEEDQRYVERLCEAYQVPCHSFTYDIKGIAKEQGMTGEEAGRMMRYQSFYHVAKQICTLGKPEGQERNESAQESGSKKGVQSPSVKIAVAQNLNDQGETLLMRILRGTGTDGLSGIEYKRLGLGGFSIIRPLLDITREEIELYCNAKGLKPQIDLTNLQPIYTRNKVRLDLIPAIQENYNENILLALNRLSKIAKEDKDYFHQVVNETVDQYAQEHSHESCSMELERLRTLHPAIRNRVIIELFGRIGLVQNITATHMEAATNLIKEGKTPASIDFPNGYAVGISYDRVKLYKKRERNCENCELNGHLEAKLVKDIETVEQKKNVQAFDYDELKKTGCNPILRTREQGDWIRPKGMQGTKKMQDFFVDAKIKKEERDFLPLVCLGSEVIWAIGYRVSENYRVKEKTKNILLLEYYS